MMDYKNKHGDSYGLLTEVCEYQIGGLAIYLYDNEGEPFTLLTVNLGGDPGKDMAYVDTNNFPDALNLISAYNLGEVVGCGHSGFCTYPLVKFNLDEVKKHDADTYFQKVV